MLFKICAYFLVFIVVAREITCSVPNVKLSSRKYLQKTAVVPSMKPSPEFGVLRLFNGRSKPSAKGRSKFKKVSKKVRKDLDKTHSLFSEKADIFPKVRGANNRNVHKRRFGGLINRQGEPSRKYFGNYDSVKRAPSSKSLKNKARQSRLDKARDGKLDDRSQPFKKSYSGRSNSKPYAAGRNTNGRFAKRENTKYGQANGRSNFRQGNSYFEKRPERRSYQRSYGTANKIEPEPSPRIYTRTNGNRVPENTGKKPQNGRNFKKSTGQIKSKQHQPKKTRKKSIKKNWSYDDKPKRLKGAGPLPPSQGVSKSPGPKKFSSLFDNIPQVENEFKEQEAKKREKREQKKIKRENIKQTRTQAKKQSGTPIKTKEVNIKTNLEPETVQKQAEVPQMYNNEGGNYMPPLGRAPMNNVPWLPQSPTMQRFGPPISPINMRQDALPRSYGYSSIRRNNNQPCMENSECFFDSDDYREGVSSSLESEENDLMRKEPEGIADMGDGYTMMPVIGNTTDIYGNLTNTTVDVNSTTIVIETTAVFDLADK